MKRLYLLIFLLVIFSLNVYGIELGISPTKIKFNGDINERLCNNITLYSKNYIGFLIGEDRWKDGESSKYLNEYNLDSEFLNISIDYPKKLESGSLSFEKDIDVCINAMEGGRFYGALIFHTENGYAGVGTWIIVDTGNRVESLIKKTAKVEQFNEETALTPITGSVVKLSSSIQNSVTLFLLIVVFIVISLWAMKRYL